MVPAARAAAESSVGRVYRERSGALHVQVYISAASTVRISIIGRDIGTTPQSDSQIAKTQMIASQQGVCTLRQKRENTMFRYPARLKAEGVGFTVTFRDIPEAITAGETREEAVEMAADALATAVDFYFEDKRPVLLPSDAKRGETLIELRVSVAAKVPLLIAMLEQQVTAAELARRMHTRPQEVNRGIDVDHATEINRIASALAALRMRLELNLIPA